MYNFFQWHKLQNEKSDDNGSEVNYKRGKQEPKDYFQQKKALNGFKLLLVLNFRKIILSH